MVGEGFEWSKTVVAAFVLVRNMLVSCGLYPNVNMVKKNQTEPNRVLAVHGRQGPERPVDSWLTVETGVPGTPNSSPGDRVVKGVVEGSRGASGSASDWCFTPREPGCRH